MTLLPDEIREKLPALYANQKIGDGAICVVKYFALASGWTWYASEFDGQDTFFGLVIGQDMELGYFSFSELSSLVPLIERDTFYKPQTVAYLKQFYRQNEHAY